MSRPLRVVRPGQPLHIVQRGNNRATSFNDDDDLLYYKRAVGFAARKVGCAIHSYVFMSNHVHLLVTPRDAWSASKMMQMVGRRYVRYFNFRHARSGTLWEGRFRSALIDSVNYFFACSRYIELNPARAGIVTHPADYRWSSFRHSTEGEADWLVTPHELFDALGRTETERRAAYRAMFASVLDDETIAVIRRATNSRSSVLSSQHHEESERSRSWSPRERGGPKEFALFYGSGSR